MPITHYPTIDREFFYQMDYYQPFFRPIPGLQPCGTSLDYDPDFLLLQSKLQPRLEAEYGKFTEAADPINWAEVERECHALLAKSRDVRLIVVLMRCRIRVVGLRSIDEGLQALLALLQQWPDDLFPTLLDEGEFEPLLRANAFSELEDPYGLINDLRAHPLSRTLGTQCTVKDIERALATPWDENTLPEATVRAMLNEWHQQQDLEITSLDKARQCLQQLNSLLNDSLGDVAPTFDHLNHLLQLFTPGDEPLTQSSRSILGQETSVCPSPVLPTHPSDHEEKSEPVSLSPQPFAKIQNREQALNYLKEVQAWFVAVEPGSPVILLLQFALKTSGKSFTELLQLLPADIVSHLNNVEKK
ncbi:hypothetical protein C9426_31620 [Serratia sp. S1B]|nr:hypothetical protein C9426_31620 [Serratia sp. S1B]